MLETLKTTTTSALLEGLYDPANRPIWEEFDARYRPIIVGLSRRLGLDDADAADLAQDTMIRFVQEYRLGKYDRRRGRLRTWILSMLRFRIADLRRERAGRREQRGDSAMVDLASDDEFEELWENERRRALLNQAIEELRQTTRTDARTLRAFELYAVHQHSAQAVADELGLTIHDVYMAKNRVADRLRDILTRLDAMFDDG